MSRSHLLAFWVFVGIMLVRQVLYLAFRVKYKRGSTEKSARTEDRAGTILLYVFYFATWIASTVALYANAFSPFSYGAGLIFVVAGAALRLKALHGLGSQYANNIVIESDSKLITSGVYAWVRHPLHLAFVIEATGMAVLGGGVATWVLVAITVLVLARRTRIEDAVLREIFKEEAERYQARVPAVNIFTWFWRRSSRHRL